MRSRWISTILVVTSASLGLVSSMYFTSGWIEKGNAVEPQDLIEAERTEVKESGDPFLQDPAQQMGPNQLENVQGANPFPTSEVTAEPPQGINQAPPQSVPQNSSQSSMPSNDQTASAGPEGPQHAKTLPPPPPPPPPPPTPSPEANPTPAPQDPVPSPPIEAAPTASPGQPDTMASPPTSSPSPVAGSSGSGQEGLADTLQSILEPFIYKADNRRDPFEPFNEANMGRGNVLGPLLPLQRYDLDEIRLIGIIWNVRAPKAMFEDPGKNIHVLGKDDRIGRNNGYIAVIREGEVVVVETVSMRGELGYSTRVLRLAR